MAKPAPPGNAVTTTFQIGTYNPLNENANSDGFTLTVDLDDTTATWIMPNSLKVPAPEKTWVESGNIRSPGVAVVRWQYKNRTVDVSISIRGSNYAALQTTVAAIKAAVENPPYTIRFAWPGASQYSYFDVVKCTHNLPSDPILWLNKALPHYELHFECMPGIRGDMVILDNLVNNPGFEFPAGGGNATTMPMVFNDSFTNVNAYVSLVGSAPSVASNILTVPSGATVGFGSPAWGAVQNWQPRWEFQTGLTATFILHRTDANNFLSCVITSTTITLNHVVAGTTHQLATSTFTALTNTNFYWVSITQFPTVSGNPPMVSATLYNDSAGSRGTAVGSGGIGPVATFDAVTALAGKPAFAAAGAALLVGGNFATGVHTWTLFGPGGYTFASAGTGLGSFSWDGTRSELGMSGNGIAGTNTTNLGPVTSFGALRLDLPPAGNVNMQVRGGDPTSGATVKQTATPVSAPLDVLGVSWQVKSTGLQSTCSQFLFFNEYDSTGTFLRTGANLGVVTGNQAAWAKQSTTYATGANCAYVIAMPSAFDGGATSANGTVWFDNIQVWDQTATGMASMNYHELRSPNSPAQLMVSGLLGDMPAPAFTSMAMYLASLAASHSAQMWLGRRAKASASAALVSAGAPRTNAGETFTLDTASYGGFSTSPGVTLGLIEHHPSDALGTYHVFTREQITAVTGGVTNIGLAPQMYLRSTPLNQTNGVSNNVLGYLDGSVVPGVNYPFSATSTWTVADCGQVLIPPGNASALNDLTKNFASQQLILGGSASGISGIQNWMADLPIDADLIAATLVNDTGSTVITTQWAYAYLDAGLAGATPAASLSLETAQLANPANAAMGTGSANILAPALQTGGSPGLFLDPTVAIAGTSGINQFVLIAYDDAATVLAAGVQFRYSPLYISPR